MTTKKNRKVKKFWKNEKNALFLVVSSLSGSFVFFALTYTFFPDPIKYWWLLPIASTLISLPRLYEQNSKLKDKEPLLIKFSKGFKSGFYSLKSFAPNFMAWKIKILALLNENEQQV